MGVLELIIDSKQLQWAGLQSELIGLLAERGADLNRDRGKLLWNALVASESTTARMLLAYGLRWTCALPPGSTAPI